MSTNPHTCIVYVNDNESKEALKGIKNKEIRDALVNWNRLEFESFAALTMFIMRAVRQVTKLKLTIDIDFYSEIVHFTISKGE